MRPEIGSPLFWLLQTIGLDDVVKEVEEMMAGGVHGYGKVVVKLT